MRYYELVFEPWIKYPPLTKERLQAIAESMRRVRKETSELHDSAGGDNGWSLGCRAYARTCFALRRAILDHPWLTEVKEDNGNQFTFAVGGIPIRFYHGDASEAPEKFLSKTFGELQQLELIDLGIPADTVLRIAVETDAGGRPTIITLVELGLDNKPKNCYIIPSDEGKVVPLQKRPIELPPARFEPIKEADAESLKDKKRDRDAG